MLAFVDQAGEPHPSSRDPVCVLLAVCMRDSTFAELSRASHAIKKDFEWTVSGWPREIHAKEDANRDAWRARNRPNSPRWRLFKHAFEAYLRHEVVTLGVLMKRPKSLPTTPKNELPPQYFFLLQRVEAVAARWREGHVTVVFDEVDRWKDRVKAFAFTNLLQRYWDGHYFSRIVPVPLFGDSAVNTGLEVADNFAYAVFVDERRRALKHAASAGYLKEFAELREKVEGKAVYVRDPHVDRRLYGFYNMPEKDFYR